MMLCDVSLFQFIMIGFGQSYHIHENPGNLGIYSDGSLTSLFTFLREVSHQLPKAVCEVLCGSSQGLDE